MSDACDPRLVSDLSVYSVPQCVEPSSAPSRPSTPPVQAHGSRSTSPQPPPSLPTLQAECAYEGWYRSIDTPTNRNGKLAPALALAAFLATNRDAAGFSHRHRVRSVIGCQPTAS
eukprot:scaffold89913_cov31-Tisochrysis_lutea.AAC.1